MKTSILFLIIFVLSQELTAPKAWSYDHAYSFSCSLLFSEKSSSGSTRPGQVLAKLGIPWQTIARFHNLKSINGAKRDLIFSSLDQLANRQDHVHASLKLAYAEISRLWIELWISQSDQNQDIQHLLQFPQKMDQLFVKKNGGSRRLLIQKQSLESFAEFLNEVNQSVKNSSSTDLSLRNMVEAILAQTNPNRRPTKLERHLLSLSKSRREEFVRTCLP